MHLYYRCPHCPTNSIQTKEVKIDDIDFHLLCHTENLYKCQYCDYIDFNRVELRKHMTKVHQPLTVSKNQSNIIVIRQSKPEDYSIDRTIIQGIFFIFFINLNFIISILLYLFINFKIQMPEALWICVCDLCFVFR